MTLERKQTLIIGLATLFMISLLIVAWVEGGRRRIVRAPDAVVTSENSDCVDCHRVKSPGIVSQWEISEHATSGIGCLQCHQAQPGDIEEYQTCLLYTSPSPRDRTRSRMPSSA